MSIYAFIKVDIKKERIIAQKEEKEVQKIETASSEDQAR
jgi:hypothetical protein